MQFVQLLTSLDTNLVSNWNITGKDLRQVQISHRQLEKFDFFFKKVNNSSASFSSPTPPKHKETKPKTAKWCGCKIWTNSWASGNESHLFSLKSQTAFPWSGIVARLSRCVVFVSRWRAEGRGRCLLWTGSVYQSWHPLEATVRRMLTQEAGGCQVFHRWCRNNKHAE